MTDKTLYMVLFQGDDVLMTTEAPNAYEARKKFNRQLTFKRLPKG